MYNKFKRKWYNNRLNDINALTNNKRIPKQYVNLLIFVAYARVYVNV